MSQTAMDKQTMIPHDIYSLTHYDLAFAGWWWALLVFFVIVCGFLSYLWWKKRKKSSKIHHHEVDPLVSIKMQLDSLTPSMPFEGKDQQEYYFKLSFLFRRFIEQRFPLIQATDLTVKELSGLLRNRIPMARESVDAIIAFLHRADLIKFADVGSDFEEAQKYHSQVKQWVMYLMPSQGNSELPSAQIKGAVVTTEAKGSSHDLSFR